MKQRGLIFLTVVLTALILILFNLSSVPLISAETLSDTSSLTLDINAGALFCENTATTSHWVDYTSGSKVQTESIFDCHRADSINGDCCPTGAGYSCALQSDGNSYYCEYTGAQYCSDIKNENECDSAGTDKAENEIAENINCEQKDPEDSELTYYDSSGESVTESDSWVKFCWNVINCKCDWVGTGKHPCTAIAQTSQKCYNKVTTELIPKEPTCRWTLTTWDIKCESEGIINAAWTATIEPSEATFSECQDKEKIISCENIVKLSFFTTINIIIAIILIILIYIFYPRRKKSKIIINKNKQIQNNKIQNNKNKQIQNNKIQNNKKTKTKKINL